MSFFWLSQNTSGLFWSFLLFVLLSSWFFMWFFWIISFGEKLVDMSFKLFLIDLRKFMMHLFAQHSNVIFQFPSFFCFNLYLFQGIFALLSVANYNFLLLVQPCFLTIGCFNNGKIDYWKSKPSSANNRTRRFKGWSGITDTL